MNRNTLIETKMNDVIGRQMRKNENVMHFN